MSRYHAISLQDKEKVNVCFPVTLPRAFNIILFKIPIRIIKRQFSFFTEKKTHKDNSNSGFPQGSTIVPILQEQPQTLSLLIFVILSPSPSATGVAVSGRNFGGCFSDRDFNWKWISASKPCHSALSAHYCLFLFLLLSCWGLMQNPSAYFVDPHLPLQSSGL